MSVPRLAVLLLLCVICGSSTLVLSTSRPPLLSMPTAWSPQRCARMDPAPLLVASIHVRSVFKRKCAGANQSACALGCLHVSSSSKLEKERGRSAWAEVHTIKFYTTLERVARLFRRNCYNAVIHREKENPHMLSLMLPKTERKRMMTR
jgi:hypothetical protein